MPRQLQVTGRLEIFEADVFAPPGLSFLCMCGLRFKALKRRIYMQVSTAQFDVKFLIYDDDFNSPGDGTIKISLGTKVKNTRRCASRFMTNDRISTLNITGLHHDIESGTCKLMLLCDSSCKRYEQSACKERN